MDRVLNDEIIAKLCFEHLTPAECRVVRDVCLAKPAIVASLSGQLRGTGPEVAARMLEICQSARTGGEA